MPLELKPPGDRGRKFWYIRGSVVRGGKRYDESTGTVDKAEAENRKAELEYIIRKELDQQERVTFRFAAEAFKKFRKLKSYDIKRIDDVMDVLGDTSVRDITQATLVDVAEELRPGYHPATLNRDIKYPISAVMRYAAKNQWCVPALFEKFREPTPDKRDVDVKTARKLIKATTGIERLYLLWAFKHADRITNTLNIVGGDIDLKSKTYRMKATKSDKWRVAPLDEEVVKQLKGVFPEGLPDGLIFPWRNRWGVYRWLIPLCKKLKIDFRPHDARHSVLTWIGNSGGSILQIKGRGGHANIASSEPYLNESLKAVRTITAKFKLT